MSFSILGLVSEKRRILRHKSRGDEVGPKSTPVSPSSGPANDEACSLTPFTRSLLPPPRRKTKQNRCGGEHQDWEEWVKDKSREESLANAGLEGEADTTATSVAAKTLCIPFDQPDLPEGTKCIASGLPATCWVMWGRSY